jgi:alpha-tubulin suppressor-like RCC1 family protein
MTDGGEVFSWDLGGYRHCGHGFNGLSQLLPRRVEALTGVRARSASAGGTHSLVMTEEGVVYSCGRDEYGHLGRVGEEHYPA